MQNAFLADIRAYALAGLVIHSGPIGSMPNGAEKTAAITAFNAIVDNRTASVAAIRDAVTASLNALVAELNAGKL